VAVTDPIIRRIVSEKRAGAPAPMIARYAITEALHIIAAHDGTAADCTLCHEVMNRAVDDLRTPRPFDLTGASIVVPYDGADVFDVPDTSLSPTEPDQLVPWLRALPVGAVLLDRRADAWQARKANGDGPIIISCVTGGKGTYLEDKYAADYLAEWAPYRLVWTSAG